MRPMCRSYPQTKFGLQNRAFNRRWYENNEWMEYSLSTDAVFCFACRHFHCGGSGRGSFHQEKAFSKDGFRTWSKATTTFQSHNRSRGHKLAMDAWLEYKVRKENDSLRIGRLDEEHLKLETAIHPEHSPIVQLNIGGHLFSTTLKTLRKHPGSKLSDMFNNQPKDSEGRYFIDRNGAHFGAILEYLRTDRLPKENILEVHQEAVYFDIKPLVKQLEEMPQLFGEAVGRQQFISKVPNYKENIEVLIRVARAEAVASRQSTIIICVLRTEDDAGLYDNAINSLEAGKHSVVTFGPWKANPTTTDLLDCIRMDVEARGYRVSIQPHNTDKVFRFKSYDCFFKLIFTWW